MIDDNTVNIRNDVLKSRENMVHFLSKATNTNAKSVKIRVGRNSGLELPYVSVRCLVQQRVRVFFTSENPTSANKIVGFSSVIIKNANGEEWRKTNEEKFPPIVLNEVEKQFLLGVHNEPQSYVEDHGVDLRMRQILLPDGNGNYLGIVPLQSMPLVRMAQKTAQEIATADEKQDVYRRLPEIGYPVGGGVSRTAGLETGFRKFVVTGFYRASVEASRRASALHRGVASRLKIDRETLQKYAQFLMHCNWSTYEEKAHFGYVRRIVEHYWQQADQVANTLSGEDIESMESDLDKGLLDVSHRGPSWSRTFADWVYRKMKSEPVEFKDGQPLYLSGVNRNYLRKIIREVVS